MVRVRFFVEVVLLLEEIVVGLTEKVVVVAVVLVVAYHKINQYTYHQFWNLKLVAKNIVKIQTFEK